MHPPIASCPLRLRAWIALALTLGLAAGQSLAQTTYSSNTTISTAISAPDGFTVTGGAVVDVGSGGSLNASTDNPGYVGGDFDTAGAGTIRVAGGGQVNDGDTYIGLLSGSSGDVTVSDSGSIWQSYNAYVGYGGSGSVTVSNGGTFTVAGGTGTVQVGGDSGGTGTINIGAAANAAAANAGVLQASHIAVNNGEVGTLQFNTLGTTYFTTNGTSTGSRIRTTGKLDLVVTAGINVLSDQLDHTGTTTVNGGTLKLAGTITSSAVTVNSGGTLAGNFGVDDSNGGAIYGSVTVASGGMLSTGDSFLAIHGGLNLADGSLLKIALGPTDTNTYYPLLVSSGPLTFGGTTIINLSDQGNFSAGTYDLIDASSTTIVGWNSNSIQLGDVIAGYDYSLGWSGKILQLTATASAIPEPSTCALLAGLSALGLAGCFRQRSRPVRSAR